MRWALIGLWSVVGILAGSWAKVFFTITRDGSITLLESNTVIAGMELGLALSLALLAIFGIVLLIGGKKEE